MTGTACVECGHLHFDDRRGYLPCPIVDCSCPLALGDPVHRHDVTMRGDHPAVNVKVNADAYALLPLELGMVREVGATDFRTIRTDPGFTRDWVDANLTEDEQESWFQTACEDGWEAAKDLAAETFGAHVRVYSEGRSAGWLVVHGLGDPEEWTTDERRQWDTFEAEARAIADDVPRSWLEAIHSNVFEFQAEECSYETSAPILVTLHSDGSVSLTVDTSEIGDVASTSVDGLVRAAIDAGRVTLDI